MHTATKVVIITERSILDGVAAIIEARGGTGYTFVEAGGKGSRGRRGSGRAQVAGGISQNVKIEAIVANHDVAEAITDDVVAKYFTNYAGVAYVETVEILRPEKFSLV